MVRHEFQAVRSCLSGVDVVIANSRRAFPRHWHDQFGVGVIEAGAQRSASGRGPVEAQAGDVITCNPGEVHDGSPIGDQSRAWRMLYIEPWLIADLAHDLHEGRAGACEFASPVTSDARIASRVRAALGVVAAKRETAAPLRAEELLLRLLGDLLSPRPLAASPPSACNAVARCRQRIDDDPAAPATLAELARETGLSRFQLLRSFARMTSLTPHAYMLQQRTCLARRLIRRGVSLAEAAQASGFSDQSHMTRAFARFRGISPGAYASAS
jgi:AraC-like DNA-binding protein